MGLSVLNPSSIPLNCGVAVLLPSESTDTVTVEAKDNVSVSCVADVTLELEIMSQSSSYFASDDNLLSLLSLLVLISCSSSELLHKYTSD